MVRVPLGTPGEPHVPPQNADTAKQLTVTQQSQEEVARVKEQLAFQVEQVKREAEMKVSSGSALSPPRPGKCSLGSRGRGGCCCWALIPGRVALAPQEGVNL